MIDSIQRRARSIPDRRVPPIRTRCYYTLVDHTRLAGVIEHRGGPILQVDWEKQTRDIMESKG